MKKNENIDIDHKIVAKHFASNFTNIKTAISTLLRAKKRYKENGKGVWSLYVKAYNWDMHINNTQKDKK